MSHLQNTGSATLWVAIGMILKQGMRLISNLIMTRILLPEIFGLMAIVNMVIQALRMLSDIGIRPSIIRSTRSDTTFLQTAWTAKIVRGLVLWLVLVAIAWPVSLFYEQTQLLYLLPCSGIMVLLMGISSIDVIRYQKILLYKRLVVLEIVAALIGLGAMILVGLHFQSVWALVIGGVLTTFCMTVFSFIFFHGTRHAFCWDKSVVKELFHFGKWVFLSTALTFFAGQYDRMALGKLADMTALGLYSVALVWAQIPPMVIGQISDRILLPVFTSYYHDDDVGNLVRIRNSVLRFSALMCIFMIAMSETIIEILYSAEYIEAGKILLILAIFGWFSIIEAINTSLLLVVGRPRDKIASQTLGLIALVLFAAWAYSSYGILGLASIAVVSMLFRAFALDLQLRKDGMDLIPGDIGMSVLVIIIGIGFYWIVEYQLDNVNVVFIFLTALFVTGVTAILMLLNDDTLRNLLRL